MHNNKMHNSKKEAQLSKENKWKKVERMYNKIRKENK